MIVPCPFCGSYEWNVECFGFSLASRYDYWRVVCQECGAMTGWKGSSDEAREAWNKRVAYEEKPIGED